MNVIDRNSRMQKRLHFGEMKRVLSSMQERDMAYLQDMSAMTGLPIKRLIDLFCPDRTGDK